MKLLSKHFRRQSWKWWPFFCWNQLNSFILKGCNLKNLRWQVKLFVCKQLWIVSYVILLMISQWFIGIWWISQFLAFWSFKWYHNNKTWLLLTLSFLLKWKLFLPPCTTFDWTLSRFPLLNTAWVFYITHTDCLL